MLVINKLQTALKALETLHHVDNFLEMSSTIEYR